MGTEQHLEGAFGRAAPEHYAWQTEHPVVGVRERDMVRKAFEPVGQRVLDLGCAEGATLYHLGAPKGAIGLDIFQDKLDFAQQQLPGCSFVKGSGYELPFEDGRFDHVIVRDVVHHMDEPDRAIDEIHRVLAPRGRIDVLEPCGLNPLIALHALTHRSERGEFRSTERYLSKLIGRRFGDLRIERMQPFPFHRLIFHPTIGSPKLAAIPAARKLVDGLEAVWAAVLPKSMWAWIHVRAARRD